MLDDSGVCEFNVLNYMEYQLHVLKRAAFAMPYSKSAEMQMQLVPIASPTRDCRAEGLQAFLGEHAYTKTVSIYAVPTLNFLSKISGELWFALGSYG